MTIATVNCPHCDCAYRMERGDEIRTKDCAACGNDLCGECAQFECASCDLPHCAEHKVVYDDETVCASCALAWVQDAVRQAQRLLEERMEQRMARAIAATPDWRAGAANEPCPLFEEKEVA
jgi:hypothetical protein